METSKLWSFPPERASMGTRGDLLQDLNQHLNEKLVRKPPSQAKPLSLPKSQVFLLVTLVIDSVTISESEVVTPSNGKLSSMPPRCCSFQILILSK